MKTKLRASLEGKIEEWINQICEEHSNESGGYYHPGLSHQMAVAAAIVFDASFDAQEFAEEQRS